MQGNKRMKFPIRFVSDSSQMENKISIDDGCEYNLSDSTAEKVNKISISFKSIKDLDSLLIEVLNDHSIKIHSGTCIVEKLNDEYELSHQEFNVGFLENNILRILILNSANGNLRLFSEPYCNEKTINKDEKAILILNDPNLSRFHACEDTNSIELHTLLYFNISISSILTCWSDEYAISFS